MAPYDDLDEMRVVDKHGDAIDDDIRVREKPKDKKAGRGTASGGSASDPKGKRGRDDDKKPKKSAYMQQKEAEARAAKLKIIGTLAAVFAVLMALLIGVGIMMYNRSAGQRAQADPNRTSYHNDANIPAMSAEGVKGLLKEAYFTMSGDLAVTLNLSNGTAQQHTVSKINIRIFNGDNQTVAEQAVTDFGKKCVVPANGRSEVYFVISRKNVKLPSDPLSKLGTTLEITSVGSGNNQSSGDGPKDVAPGRKYYENTGNIPELSTEGVKATIIRAQYTNDGSLKVTLSLSNGTDADKTVSGVNVTINNGDGQTIASQNFTSLEKPCKVATNSYEELTLIIDRPNVPLQDDTLSTISTTISVSAG